MKPGPHYVAKMRELHLRMRDHLLRTCTRRRIRKLPPVRRRGNKAAIGSVKEKTWRGCRDVRGGDTIYTIDEHGEAILLDFCREWSHAKPRSC
jgi:hypothetical protein